MISKIPVFRYAYKEFCIKLFLWSLWALTCNEWFHRHGLFILWWYNFISFTVTLIQFKYNWVLNSLKRKFLFKMFFFNFSHISPCLFFLKGRVRPLLSAYVFLGIFCSWKYSLLETERAALYYQSLNIYKVLQNSVLSFPYPTLTSEVPTKTGVKR